MKTHVTLRALAVASALSLAACGGGSTADEEAPPPGDTAGAEASVEEPPPEEAPALALATVAPTEGNEVSGTVVFTEVDGGVTVQIDLTGLPPQTEHGFHVHENGDCSAPDGTSAGGHYNPGGHDHALPDEGMPRHAGDMGNLVADASGEVHESRTFTTLSVDGADPPPVAGRAVIVHADPDDGGQPTGNAGARVACGVIELQ